METTVNKPETSAFDVEQVTELMKAVLQESNPREALMLVESHGLWPVGFYEQLALILDQTADFTDRDTELGIEIAKLFKDTGKISDDVYDVYCMAILKPLEEEIKTDQKEETTTEQPVTIEAVVEEAMAILTAYPDGQQLTDAEQAAKEEKILALQAQVGKLSGERFNDLREKLGSSFLAAAETELPADGLGQLFDLTELLLGKDQLELLQSLFVAYQIVHEKAGTSLYFRHPEDRTPYAKLVNYRMVYKNFVDWFKLNRDTLTDEERIKYYHVVKNLSFVLSKLHAGSQPEASAGIIKAKQEIESEEELRSSMTMVAQIEANLAKDFKESGELGILLNMRNDKERELTELLTEADGKVLGQARTYLDQVLITYGIIKSLDREIAEAKQHPTTNEDVDVSTGLRVKTLEISLKILEAEIEGRARGLDNVKGKAKERLEQQLLRLKSERASIETMISASSKRSIHEVKGGVQ